MEILRTVSGYVAVAIENSLLYQEQQERAAELELLKEFNESIVESINVGLLAVDLDGRVTRCNSALEKILGVRRDDAIGRRVEDLFAEDFAETLHQVLGSARWKLTELRHIYKLHTATHAGRTLVLNIALAPLQADSQGRTGALVVLEDVTSRMRLEEQLQQREKLSSIGLLAAGVAHEVNTPLTGVSSYTQMLMGMLPETDPKHALLQKVRRQADRASDIVNNLLNFSRTGGATEFTELDVNRVMDDTIQLLEPQLRRSQMEIARAYDPELPPTYGNAVKLQQVFTNLILNARDAILEGGRITLFTASTDRGDHRHRNLRHRHGHRARKRRQDLRPVLHDQGRRARHGPRPRRLLRHRPGARRPHRGREHAGQGHHVPHHAPDRQRPRAPTGRGERLSEVLNLSLVPET